MSHRRWKKHELTMPPDHDWERFGRISYKRRTVTKTQAEGDDDRNVLVMLQVRGWALVREDECSPGM